MSGLETVRLAAALADVTGRPAAAERLARHLGASALVILVKDADVAAFVPAPGFQPTLPGGPAWRSLLQAPPQAGIHRGELEYPAPGTLVPAYVLAEAGLLLVFIGACDPRELQAMGSITPLLASTLNAEHAVLVARGELAVARNQARQAETLAQALDTARAEHEHSLRELERQTRELHEARARAEEGAQAKDEFLAMLGHELRNPLSPIVTALQLMRLKNQSSREQDIIERQVASLMRLVDDLLDVSRITEGKIELRKARVELAEVAARAIEMASPMLEKKQQRLSVDIPARGCIVDADASRLAQVLANLLTNASKYSDANTEIVFRAGCQDRMVRISVRDQGIGISPQMLDTVFDLFVQNRQSIARSQGGLGLGLAIVRSLVALHGGTVTAHSKGEGQGSEFVVQLPLAAGSVALLPAQTLTTVAGLHRKGRDAARVLVVDDNDDATALINEALDSLGYEVRTAPDGLAALRIAAEFKPQVALLDIGLPVMDGYELAQRLRASPGLEALRLVAVTGYGQRKDKRRSKLAGFDAHLVKPVGLRQLQQVFETFRVTG